MNAKRIAALIAVLFILLLYIAAIVLAVMNDPRFVRFFVFCVICTIALPVIIHLFLMMKNVKDGKSVMDETYRFKEKPDENSRS